MDSYDSMFSAGFVLNEQIARQIFKILPQDGPFMILMDRSGNCWPSDSEEFSNLRLTELFLQELCDRIDDGHEPLVTQTDGASLIAAQLVTANTNCGYVIYVMPGENPESALANSALIEILIAQVNLIAELIEKNNGFYAHQMKQAVGVN